MKGIGGNTYATIQVYTSTKNDIGELVKSWNDVLVIKGWLDLQSGTSEKATYYSKLQESTHIFISDYVSMPSIKPENSRMVIDGNRYDLLLIDNPMGMKHGSQLEFYLKFTGGA